MSVLKDIGERALIENIKRIIRPSPGIGPGDDAAMIDVEGKVVISTDTVTVERHMPKEMSWEQFGWTAAAVNLSDIASMGARPVGVLAALAMPENMEERNLYDIMSGMDQCTELCGTYIVGGDTKFGPGLITGTAVGSLDGRPPLTRSGAVPGDFIAVTGEMGSAAAGFYALQNGTADEELTSQLFTPVPRTDMGIKLSKSGAVTSCMDLSDGLAEGAKAICDSSHVGMEIEMEFIPINPKTEEVAHELDMDLADLALYWGGDYELLFTFKKEKMPDLYNMDVDFSIIGMVTNGDGPYITVNGTRTRMKNGKY